MTEPSIEELFAALEATWRPAGMRRIGPWRIRDGDGGGQRVTSTTAEAPVDDSDIEVAENAMSQLGQSRIFMIRPGEDRLDAMLARRGYRIKDPVAVHMAETAPLAAVPLPRASVFHIYPPLEIMAELWTSAEVGPERLAVMKRVGNPKTALLARSGDRPAGVAFAAVHERLVIVHAIFVSNTLRRRGVGSNILRAAARWAAKRGASHLALAATRANKTGSALYASNGMKILSGYHYRTE